MEPLFIWGDFPMNVPPWQKVNASTKEVPKVTFHQILLPPKYTQKST